MVFSLSPNWTIKASRSPQDVRNPYVSSCFSTYFPLWICGMSSWLMLEDFSYIYKLRYTVKNTRIIFIHQFQECCFEDFLAVWFTYCWKWMSLVISSIDDEAVVVEHSFANRTIFSFQNNQIIGLINWCVRWGRRKDGWVWWELWTRR